MGIDVRELNNEGLPLAAFPAKPCADFRLHLAPAVHRGILQHAQSDKSIEICGVLVGGWSMDENGPYAAVTDYIRCDNASSRGAEVTFTHESWSHINKELDTKYAEKRIVGWYHSHPDYGIFLSDRDCFIHEHFFSGPGQIAYVIDPVRNEEGVFAWKNGKPSPLSYYWIGDDILSGFATPGHAQIEKSATPHSDPSSSLPAQNASIFGSFQVTGASAVLGLLIVFLIGWLIGGLRTDWERQMTIAGAVAHFADAKLIREGLREELLAVETRLAAIGDRVEKLPEPPGELSKKEQNEAEQSKKFIAENLALSEAALARISERYGLSDLERAIVAQYVARTQTELRKQMEAADKDIPEQKSKAKTASGGKNKTNDSDTPKAPAKNSAPLSGSQDVPDRAQ